MKVEYIGTFYNNHSLSIVNRSIVTELVKLQNDDFELFVTPLDTFTPDCNLDKAVAKEIKSLSNKETEDPMDIQIRHSYPPIWRWPISPITKVVYIQPWEFSRVPMEWVYKWEQFGDAIIAPSRWVSDRYLESGVDPERLFTIHNGYDPKIFNKDPEPSKFFDSKKFTFTYVGCGQFRKGIDILLECWRQVFTKADNAQLVIVDSPHIYGVNNLLEEIIKMQFKTGCGKIVYLDNNFSHKDMANIYKNTTVLVHPFRGEGFGLHILEAAACGALPLVSAGGPPNEFLHPDAAAYFAVDRTFIDIGSPQVFAGKPGDSFSLMSQNTWINEPVKVDVMNKLKMIYHHKSKDDMRHSISGIVYPNTWEAAASGYYEALKKINTFKAVNRRGVQYDSPQQVER